MKTQKSIFSSLAALALAGALALPASAAPIITNGGFESGPFGWSSADKLGSDGTFQVQSGTTSPINGDTVPAPPGGVYAAMTDGGAGGSHVLYQDFTISSGGPNFTLAFALFLQNQGGMFATPAPDDLEWSGNYANQQFRVDIIQASADPFTVTPADILMNLYQSQDGDPLVSGYNTLNFDISSLVNANLGTALRLRFVEVDNLGPLQAGVDSVSITESSAIPEPSTVLTVAGGLLLVAARSLRRRKVQA
ncbi:MAG: hypothetical protein IPP47_12705 [Bryobacterales bacterium]|nr:hypothetical protein [Bryobacterales bacterium]